MSIDISEKGITRLRELLRLQRLRSLNQSEVTDLAILRELWDLREPLGGPIKPEELSPYSIANNVVSVYGKLQYSPVLANVKSRMVAMHSEGLIESAP
jgi:hypothetical protein